MRGAVLALVPISTGIITMRGVGDPLYRPLNLPEDPVLDSNLRVFGGVWLGVGLAFLWTVPAIEQQGLRRRAFVHLLAVARGAVRSRAVSVLGVGQDPFGGRQRSFACPRFGA